MKNTYAPIRIIKDIQISVPNKGYAKKFYPHGEVKTVNIRGVSDIKNYTVLYRAPRRIDAPTGRERELLLNNYSEGPYAMAIPQNDELKCDDPRSPLAGSRSVSERRKRKAVKEIVDRDNEEAREKRKGKNFVYNPNPDEFITNDVIKEENDE